MSKKNILIVAWSFYPAVGGMEEQSYLLAKEFIKIGFHVDVLTEKIFSHSSRFESYEGINIYRTSFQKKRTLLNYLRLSFDIGFFLLKRRKKYHFCIIRGALTFEPLLIGFFKRFGVFAAKTFVTADTGGENDEISIIKNSRFRPFFCYFASQHDFLNSICENNHKHYQELKFKINKLTKIPNGIDISGYKQKTIIDKMDIFLFIGRLFPYKGTRELLNAFEMLLKKYPKKKLIIAGIGPEYDFIRNFVTQKSLQNSIKLIGNVRRRERTKFYDAGDCLILPSHSEGFSLVVYEAAVQNKAIICTDVANIKKDFGNQIIFCEKKNATDLYHKMDYLISHYKSVKINYYERIKRYDIKNIAQQILNLIESSR